MPSPGYPVRCLLLKPGCCGAQSAEPRLQCSAVSEAGHASPGPQPSALSILQWFESRKVASEDLQAYKLYELGVLRSTPESSGERCQGKRQ